LLLTFLICCAAALAVSAAFGRAVIASGLWDTPNDVRKAHKAPTPTSGGLGIGAGFAVAVALAATPYLRGWADGLAPEDVMRAGMAALAAFAAMTIGLIDDLRPVGPKVKFGMLSGLALVFCALVARAETLPIAAGVVIDVGLVLGVLGSALFIFTLINATNFVDGANGLAMGSSAISLLGLAAVSIAHGAPHAALLAVAGAGAMIGFLVWNFPSGRLFAGDTGSLFAGCLGATASLIAIQDGGVSPFIPAILFFPTFADVLLTLAWRLQNGRNLLLAHRDHLYQIGLRAGLSHVRVTLIFWAVTAHCVLVAFLASWGARISLENGPESGAGAMLFQIAGTAASMAPVLALVILALVAVKVSNVVRRYAAARGLDTK
jgi:UDP-GlcNAc:undecaprenyl-phosphate/decaprenyl-phosphate GlcNAc-1-phosphate transferase